MRKIINGKMYDTETAEHLADYENDYISSFNYYSEELYRKKTGEFFIHGEGHANSKYAENCGNNSWGPGEAIIPLQYEAARKWAEEHLSADEYELIFGEVVEDDSKTPVTLSLAKDIYERVKREAAKEGTTISAYVENLLK